MESKENTTKAKSKFKQFGEPWSTAASTRIRHWYYWSANYWKFEKIHNREWSYKQQKCDIFFQSFCIFRIAKGPTLKFVNGKWIADGDASGNAAPDGGITQALDSAAASQEMVQLRTDVQRLGDENNMLQLKIEILLDMLTEVQQNKQETQQEMQQRMQAH